MWLQYLIKALSAVPMIVAGIEAIHGKAKSGAEKKTMAMDALGLTSMVANAMDPAHSDAINAAQVLASDTIDGVVAVMNAAKETPAQIKPVSPAVSPVVTVPVVTAQKK